MEPLRLTDIATTTLDLVKGKKTVKCFPQQSVEELVHWLGREQPAANGCVVSSCVFDRDWTPLEVARALPDAPQTDDLLDLSKWVIEHEYTLPLLQAEALTKLGGGETVMLNKNRTNSFFAKTVHPKTPVLVGHLQYGAPGWYVSKLVRFDSDFRLDPTHRFLIPMDIKALTLGQSI